MEGGCCRGEKEVVGRVLDDSELELFDCIASDLNELAGSKINYYGYDPYSLENRALIDPLYGEPTERKFSGPFRIWAQVKYPEYTPLTEEPGFSREWDAKVTISRVHLDEQNAPYPSEGDIIELWRTPFHDAWSMGKGMFFTVVKSNNDGHINQTPSFVQFKLDLKRRTQFGAERKITPP